TELGEIAYAVEKIHNRLLEEERVVTPAVLAMIAEAEKGFRTWVSALSTSGRVTADASALHAAIVAVEAEMPPGRESVLASSAPVPKPELREVPPPGPLLHDLPPLELEPLPEAEPELEPAEPQHVPLMEDAPSLALEMPMLELPEVGAAPSAPPVGPAPPAAP